MDSKGKW